MEKTKIHEMVANLGILMMLWTMVYQSKFDKIGFRMSSAHSRVTTYEQIYSQKPSFRNKELTNIYIKSLPKIRQSRIMRTAKTSTYLKPYSLHTVQYKKVVMESTASTKISKSSLLTNISADAWALFDTHSKVRFGSKENVKKEVASLTKIMTCLVVLDMMETEKIDEDIHIRVSRTAAGMNGTTGNLKENYYMKLIDILFAMMLPSGNDAAYLLAENFGLLLYCDRVLTEPQQKAYCNIQSIDVTSYESTDLFVNCFIRQMNKKARQLEMTNTSFVNPHGLQNVLNYSTAKDILNLSIFCTNYERFMDIVSTQIYTGYMQRDMEEEKDRIDITWRNTNKLLMEGWEGIKTGQTNNAGACLSSTREGVFIVVLNSENSEKRFEDTVNLYNWYCSSYR